MADRPTPIESVDRAMRILEELSKAGAHGLSLGDLSTRLGLNKSTIYRAVSTMRLREFVVQEPLTQKYALGAACLRLADSLYGAESLKISLHPVLTELSREVRELVHLGVPSGARVLYLDKVEPERALRVWSKVGQTVPAATSSLGRALLAYSGVVRDQIQVYVDAVEEDSSSMPHKAVTSSQLWGILEDVQRTGFASEFEENEPGIACLGVPLLRNSSAVAALSITAPAERMSRERVEELKAAIMHVVPGLLPDGLALPDIAG